MKIEIKSMTLQNFKKVRSQEIEFSHNMLISGGNKVGKTTIYDAYLWGIFGVLSKKNGIVQPLDKNNEVVHKLETSVTIILNINDEREVKIQRILTEKWVAKDTADEKLNGTQTERLFNDVPLSDSAFKKKLGELCNYNQWFMQSNINLFMSYKIDDMRTEIYSLTRGVNDSRVCEFHKDKECINGNGRRLGLQVLMFKALHSMSKIDELIKELNQIASDGLDAMDYNYQNGRYSNGIQF